MTASTSTHISPRAGAFPAWPKCVHLLVTLLITVIGAQVIDAQPAKVVSRKQAEGAKPDYFIYQFSELRQAIEF